MKDAMREKDVIKLSTLRLVNAAIKDRDIAARAEDRCDGIGEDEIMSLLAKMVKQRAESAKTYEDNGRPEFADRERQETELIRSFMPEQLSDDDLKSAIKAILEDTGATGLKDMGKVMGAATEKFAGAADGKIVSGIVKKLLNS